MWVDSNHFPLKLSPENRRPILMPPPKILPCRQPSMYADCLHEMIFDGGVSIDRLISGESLLLGSTQDITFVAFFVLCWYGSAVSSTIDT